MNILTTKELAKKLRVTEGIIYRIAGLGSLFFIDILLSGLLHYYSSYV
ncbi:hypothetical protein JYT87_03780 [Nitrospira defluvii]|nr:hypothetical protein [Nitrospira defluvii]